MFYIILSSKYIKIQQKSVLSKITILNNNLYKFSKQTFQFIKYNRRIVFISKSLLIYSQFWSASFSIVFLTLIVGTCYCMYCFIFLENLLFFEKFIFVFAPLQGNILLFYTTKQCANIVKNNAKIVQQNWLFFKNFSKTKSVYFSIGYFIKARYLLLF